MYVGENARIKIIGALGAFVLSRETAINWISYLDVTSKFKKVSELFLGYCPEPFEILEFRQVSATEREVTTFSPGIILSPAAFLGLETRDGSPIGKLESAYKCAEAFDVLARLRDRNSHHARSKRRSANCFVLKLRRHCVARSSTRSSRRERLDLLLKSH